MIIAHCEKRVCFHMVSPHLDTYCIFSFIHEGAEAGQFAGKYPIRIIVGNRPRMRKSQNQLSPRRFPARATRPRLSNKWGR
jgi:hypothetical protein